MTGSLVSRLFIYTAVVAVIAGASMARRPAVQAPQAVAAAQPAHALS